MAAHPRIGHGNFVNSGELDDTGTFNKANDMSFATEHKGAFANSSIDGNIGGRVIAKYRMVLDYPNGRIALVPK